MKRFLVATVAAALSALTIAAPVHADDESYLDYLKSHGYAP